MLSDNTQTYADWHDRRYNRLKLMIPEANKWGIGAGIASGAIASPLTYAGLGLIPYLKKKRAVRLIAGLLAGAGAGVGTAHLVGKHKLLHDWKELNERRGLI